MNEKFMKKSQLKKYCYKLYQLDWMRSHGYSIDDIIREIHKIWKEFEGAKKDSPKKLYEEFVDEVGFGGSLWVCFNEFCDCEFQDTEYIKHLLANSNYPDDVQAWKSYVHHYIKEK